MIGSPGATEGDTARLPADVVLYVSGHGYGHAVRCAELCRSLLQAAPTLRIQVRTIAPAWIFPPSVSTVPRALDVGVVQPDSLHLDPEATLGRYAALLTDEDTRLAAEAEEVRATGARAIVADIPSAAFAIARQVGVPGIGLGNFSWDWIYGEYADELPQFGPLVRHIAEQYGLASLLLRLPFYGDMGAFQCIEDIPLIARVSSAERRATRRALGLPLDATLVLLSFGGHAYDGPDTVGLAALDRFAFVMTGASTGASTGGASAGVGRPDNVFTVPPLGDDYVDLLAACDVCITKPGYGIVADVLANRVPTLYVSRPNFREEPILTRALETEGRALEVPRDALDSGDLGPWLDAVLRLDRPWCPRPLDGAAEAARRVLCLLDGA